jgi:hypothetical protein
MNVIPRDDRYESIVGPIRIVVRPEQTAWLIVSGPDGGEIRVELTKERIEALGKALEDVWDVATCHGNVRVLRTSAIVQAANERREADRQSRMLRWERS